MRLLAYGHNVWWTWEERGFCGCNAALERARRGKTASEVFSRVVAIDHDFGLQALVAWQMTASRDGMP